MRGAPLLALVVLVAGCSSPQEGNSGEAAPQSDPVLKMASMKDNEFRNANYALKAGDSAMYMNEGQRDHTVSVHFVGDPATTLKVDKTLKPGATETFVFAAAGTYHVYCKIHGTMTTGMTSTVTVA